MCLWPLSWLVSSIPTGLSPPARPRPSASPGDASTLEQMPPTVCQSTRMSSASALPRMRGASHAAWSSKAEANLLAAERAQGTASAPAPCSGHPARRGAYPGWHREAPRSVARQRRVASRS